MNGGGDGESAPKKSRSLSYPVDLDLEWVLGKMPQKVSLKTLYGFPIMLVPSSSCSGKLVLYSNNCLHWIATSWRGILFWIFWVLGERDILKPYEKYDTIYIHLSVKLVKFSKLIKFCIKIWEKATYYFVIQQASESCVWIIFSQCFKCSLFFSKYLVQAVDNALLELHVNRKCSSFENLLITGNLGWDI